MPKPHFLISQVYLTVEGEPVQSPVIKCLAEVIVDQHSHLPDMFSIRLHDPEFRLIDSGPFDLTKTVKIEADTSDGATVTLIEGEITALEPEFAEGMVASLVVRGYDKSHRLYREMKSIAHLNKKDSDLAEEIARAHKLKSQVDSTTTVYDHIFQDNLSDLGFLMRRAWRIGYECFVSEGTLYFRKPPTEEASLSLSWGDDLVSFRPSLNLAEQVDEVIVKGWDMMKQMTIVGRAQKGRLYPQIGEEKDGTTWAQSFEAGKHIIVDECVLNQAEADILAAARLDEISGTFGSAEGAVFRRPDIQAGRMVEFKNLGKRFSGTYLVSRATHTYTPEGFRTIVQVLGSRTGTLIEELTHAKPQKQWLGVVVAIVTNTDDEENLGRVKLKYPWMADDAESNWARLAILGGGPESGFAAIPAVGDEVLVAFAHGDFNQPYVLGGLWNGKNKLPPETKKASKGEKPLIREWRSHSGHFIAMHDNADKKIQIKTARGYTVTLDDKHKNIAITGPGNLKINMNNEIVIESGANLIIKTAGDMTFESKKVVNIRGRQVNLEAVNEATIKGVNVEIEGSIMTEVKGGMVTIN
jgi:phage protein D/phage baseplate assembly protein gpV